MKEVIYGRQAVLTALRREVPGLEEIWLAEGLTGEMPAQIRGLARAKGIPLKVVPRAALDRLCRTPHHQGVAARRAAFGYRDLEEFLGELSRLPEPPLLVAADSLTDPMNLGNLCRSALAAGAHGLIIPKDRAAPVTPVVIKAAAGALEFLPVCRVTNLAEALRRLKETGLRVVGAEADAPLSLYEADLTLPLVLVIGGEDTGIRPRVRRQCDLLVSIPLKPTPISSLNAAAAAAVLLFEIRRQRLCRGEPEPKQPVPCSAGKGLPGKPV